MRGRPPFQYWAIIGPGDEHPELFFRNEAWARAALEATNAESPGALLQVRMFAVRVTYEETS